MKENKAVELTEGNTFIIKPPTLTDEDMQHEYDYYQAQKILEEMQKQGLISVDEFNKITALNREIFCPYLAEIMPNMT